jgi:hypothetical protein
VLQKNQQDLLLIVIFSFDFEWYQKSQHEPYQQYSAFWQQKKLLHDLSIVD